jgi:hypothetical protein
MSRATQRKPRIPHTCQYTALATPCAACAALPGRVAIPAELFTRATNARAKAAGQYPYASMRLPKRMAGLPVADGKQSYGGSYVPAAGTTLVPDRKTERDLMAGKFNGETYARD